MPVLLDWGLAKTLPEKLRIAFSRYVGVGGLEARHKSFISLSYPECWFLCLLATSCRSNEG